jgi:hypothetical protein
MRAWRTNWMAEAFSKWHFGIGIGIGIGIVHNASESMIWNG